jgi:predicted transcriptional regulator
MRKLHEVLRLRFELKLSQHQIARSCSIGQARVCDYLKRAQAAGVIWPLPEGWDDARLEEALIQLHAPLRTLRRIRSTVNGHHVSVAEHFPKMSNSIA